MTGSPNDHALMQFLLEFRALSPAHQLEVCLRIRNELQRTWKGNRRHEERFLRALERYLLIMTAGEAPGRLHPERRHTRRRRSGRRPAFRKAG